MSSILEKLVENRKMPVLFIGSGISKRYLYKFPDWETLLKTSFYKVNQDPYFYQQHKDELLRKNLTDFEINKALGTIIENEFNRAFFQRKIKIKNPNPNWVSTGVSPYKMYLSIKFKNMQLYNSPWAKKELEEFQKLKNKVSAIITTNYDQFLEKHVFKNDYTVFKKQYEMFSSDSYNIAEIYKIHGCVTDADSIIITENDYKSFERTRRLFIAKMLTLFSESPIIFLGYSFTDENIQKIVQDFLDCLTQKDLDNIHEHLIFVSWKKNERNLIEIRNNITTTEGKIIPITEIQTDNFYSVFQILNKITPGISASKIRETRKVVKKIVDKSVDQGQETALMINIEDLDKISNTKALAIAVGYREDFIQDNGYKMFPESIIFEDILKDNQNLKPEKVCFDRYSSISYQRVLPIFKYAKKIPEKIQNDERLLKYIKSKDAKEKIISKTLMKRIINYPSFEKYEDIEKHINDYDSVNKKCMLLLKNVDILSTEDLRNFCIDLFDDFISNEMKDTHFKRCVLYLDFLENYEEYKEKSNQQFLEN